MVGKLLSFLGGGGLNAAGSAVTGVVETFRPNAENQARRDFSMSEKVQDSYAAEFNHRQGRTYWDSFVDGLNRLMRPAIVVVFVSVVPVLLFAGFTGNQLMVVNVSAAITALSIIPEQYWYLILGIVGFYFPLRSVDKAMAKRSDAQAQAAKTKTVIQTLKQINDLHPGLADVGDDPGDKLSGNPVLRKHGIAD